LLRLVVEAPSKYFFSKKFPPKSLRRVGPENKNKIAQEKNIVLHKTNGAMRDATTKNENVHYTHHRIQLQKKGL
jgi:hypothetical protein